jgi:hypothetical protein
MASRRNSGGAGIRQHLATGILTAPESGHCRRMLVDQIPVETGRNPAMVRSRVVIKSSSFG